MTAGNDTGTTDSFWADAPLTISTGGFTSAGSDKLVVVLSLHNSAARVAPVTSLTYGGVNLLTTQVAGNNPGGATDTSKSMIFYLDAPTTDGNLVIGLDYTTYHVDEFTVALFALNGTVAGTAYQTQSVGGGTFSPFTASAGDFVLGIGQRNNQSQIANTNTDYTNIALSSGNLNVGIAYDVLATGGSASVPVFNSTTIPQIQLLSAFAAVPEPSSALLGGLGVLLLLRRRR